MKILIQRVSGASVGVDEEVISKIGKGLLLLVGFGKEDAELCDVEQIASKISNMRIFSNDKGRFDYSLLDISGEVLVVPQFTLYADTKKGRRPEFFNALEPKKAAELTEELITVLKSIIGKEKVSSGAFGAHMKVELINDGPVTIMLES